jgi:hypothetical protein
MSAPPIALRGAYRWQARLTYHSVSNCCGATSLASWNRATTALTVRGSPHGATQMVAVG